MTQMNINGSERDTLRLFHLDLPREAVERFVTQAGTGEWPLKYGLGAARLRSAFVDVVDLRDLEEMPLSQYMIEAHGAAGEDFASMRAQIDALKGHVLILPAQAFDNTSQTLSISTPLRWVGTFSEIKPKSRGAKLRSASARGSGQAASAAAGDGASWLIKALVAGVGLVVLAVLFMALR